MGCRRCFREAPAQSLRGGPQLTNVGAWRRQKVLGTLSLEDGSLTSCVPRSRARPWPADRSLPRSASYAARARATPTTLRSGSPSVARFLASEPGTSRLDACSGAGYHDRIGNPGLEPVPRVRMSREDGKSSEYRPAGPVLRRRGTLLLARATGG